jgi:predicted ATPase/DNA-binding CsgD family transcriptional regulator/Tfp pilus assembly protein PilF
MVSKSDLSPKVTVLRSAQRPGGFLPESPTRLIGREGDLAAARDVLRHAENRLLTLTGPAGAGKTRLALALAADLADDFADGVAFVALDAIAGPALVASAIARVVNVRDAGSTPLADLLAGALRDRETLLVLDNFEQVLEAAPLVSGLLAACPDLVVIVTSRAALRLRWEREFPVQPLALPPADDEQQPEASAGAHPLQRYAAVELFVERARAVRPDFALTERNAAAVAALCRRLDGLPLAIELAASRVKVLSPQAMLDRLTDQAPAGSLGLLTGGARDLPARHQTLRDAIAWSYELLSPAAQRALRRLSVFAGGCSLEAVEAVCADGDGAVTPPLDLLTELVDHSLVVAAEGETEPRFRLLEMIREYSREQLTASGEMDATRNRHAVYVTALAEAGRPELDGVRQTEWLARLEAEHDNLRAALSWSLDGGDAATALRLVGALSRFWEVRGHLTEGRMWTERALAAGASAPARLRAHAYLGLGLLAARQTDYAGARPALEAALPLMSETGDRHGLATTLNVLGNVHRNHGDLAGARARYEESLAINRELGELRDVGIATNNLAIAAWSEGDLSRARSLLTEALAVQRSRNDRRGTAMALFNLGVIAMQQEDHLASHTLLSESLTIFREIGDRFGISMALREMGVLALNQGDLDAATPLLEDSLAIGRELGDPRSIATALTNLGIVAKERANYDRAQDYLAQALVIWRDKDVKQSIAEMLDVIASLAAASGWPARAARLWGAADSLRDATGMYRVPHKQSEYDSDTAGARAALGDAAFEAALTDGRAMDTNDAVALAITGAAGEDAGPGALTRIRTVSPPPPTPAAVPGGLTPREIEVLGLLAAGRSNRAIAEALVVSPATVHQHLINIYQKLDVHNRAEATAYAFRHGVALPATEV